MRRSLAYISALFLMVLLSIAGLVIFLTGDKELCNDHLRSKVIIGEVEADGGLRVHEDGAGDVIYPAGTFWQEGKHWWACPCLLGKCIRQCRRELARNYSLNMSRQPAKIAVLDGEIQETVLMSKHFHIVEEGRCRHGGYFLEDDKPEDEFRILVNGSIYFPNSSSTLNAEDYCIIPVQDSLKTKAVLCIEDEQGRSKSLKFRFYPIFFVLSIIFLLMTLAALFLTPTHNTFHSRSVICQAGSLLITYVGLTINYLTGENSHENLCIVTAYVTYFFLLASFFWLNVMCIDIYLTFSGLLNHTNERAFLKFSLYAWCSPLVLFTITVLLDRTTSHEQFSPGIGTKKCWFSSIWSQLIYFSGPVLILLLVNIYLFGATALRLRRMRKEAGRVLHSEDSRVHNHSMHNQQDKDRLWMYVKLFLLMGCTWFMEIISWAVGGPPEWWYLPDAINGLRGVFIFWFFVWSNKVVRQQLKDRFMPDKNKKKTESVSQPTRSSALSVESSSNTNE